MDIREKTFADEAVKQLDFLKNDYGFAGPDVSRGTYPGTVVSVSYQREGITVDARLVLSYMGEEYVATAYMGEDYVVTGEVASAPDGTAQRTEIASNTAHTGYQMRRALKLQAEAVRAALRRS